jgi:hypothetical protein
VAIEGGAKHDARRKPITDPLVNRHLTMTLLKVCNEFTVTPYAREQRPRAVGAPLAG